MKQVEDTATIDQGPRIEARQAWVMLRHVKFGVTKKKVLECCSSLTMHCCRSGELEKGFEILIDAMNFA